VRELDGLGLHVVPDVNRNDLPDGKTSGRAISFSWSRRCAPARRKFLASQSPGCRSVPLPTKVPAVIGSSTTISGQSGSLYEGADPWRTSIIDRMNVTPPPPRRRGEDQQLAIIRHAGPT